MYELAMQEETLNRAGYSETDLRSKKSEDITFFIPTRVSELEFLKAVPLAFLTDSTPEANLIFRSALLKTEKLFVPAGTKLVRADYPYGLSGIDFKDHSLRKGKPYDVSNWLASKGGFISTAAWSSICDCLRSGYAAWVVADDKSDLGIACCSVFTNPGDTVIL
jgi:high-affinity K+ transport system ATPase subunit B